MAATYEPIATTTLGSASTTVTFSSIPSTYTDLRIVCLIQATAGGVMDARYRFNNDSATNYSTTTLAGDGTSAFSGSNTNDTGIFVDGNMINQTWHFYTCDVFSYAGSTYKTALCTMSEDDNGSGRVTRQVGLWRSTSAINRVDIVSSTTRTFIAGSTFTIYGIKAA